VTEIVDTIPAFEAFADRAALESPVFREKLWRDQYEAAHADAFEGYYATQDSRSRPTRMVRELSALRRRVAAAAGTRREVIEDVDPVVREALAAPSRSAPVHVLMVGNGATNAVVGRLHGRVAVFHCLEWEQPRAPAQVLTAHELTHAWQQILLGVAAPADDDLAWLVFWEGLAIQTSRVVVPDRPEHEYFWYGVKGYESWPAWCRDRRQRLRQRLRAELDGSPEAAPMFTGQAVGEPPRAGYFVAGDLIAALGARLPELVRMPVDEARSTVRAALEGVLA